MLLALYRMRDSFYSGPPAAGLVGGSLQPRSDAGERSQSDTWAGVSGARLHMQIARCRVTEHKFKIGQLVYFQPKVRPQLDVVPGPYLITRRLPATQDGECQYEIRNTLEE